ncbi:carbohydrate binding family 9 domain-containing protein, partial [bacterium]|nr:carbohydrate binding family 9 domain-containing protein [bacterium]
MEYIAEAVRIDESEAPRIDGKFDDAVWKKGKAITGFVQRDPIPGAPATEKSEVYFLYDKENLYVGCRFYDSHPENIFRELRRREGIETSDRIELFFDTFHNHRTGFKFATNPYGVQMDEQRYDDDKRNRDWDAIWESGADIDSLGWVAEFKIPFFNMRFPDTEEQVWGFNLQREIRYKAERINWKPVSFDDRGTSIRMSKLGHLVGIKGIRPGRRFEFRPYGLSGTYESEAVSAQSKNESGFDLKYGITPDVTLDMTVNPDYAQVEADVLEINLTRYPTRFSEKREFFLEGKGIFQTPENELFYSRRIGARGDILWGTKLSGRAAGGIEYGFIGSQTGDWDYFGLGSKDSSKEEAVYGIARIRKGFSDGSSIGAMFT